MKVRFKDQYKGDGNDDDFPIFIYELNQSEPVPEYDEVMKEYGMCYDTKLLGFVLAYKMEVVHEESKNDIQAIDVFIELSKL